MGLWLSELIIDVFRQAVPVVGAVTGAYFGLHRAKKRGGKVWVNAAAFGGLGWFAGYVVNRLAMRIIEGSSPQLPSQNLQAPTLMLPAPQAPSPPTSVPLVTPPTSGMPEVDPYMFQSPREPASSSSTGTPVPPPKTRNDGVSYGPPKTPARVGRNLKLQAFGTLYGNE